MKDIFYPFLTYLYLFLAFFFLLSFIFLIFVYILQNVSYIQLIYYHHSCN